PSARAAALPHSREASSVSAGMRRTHGRPRDVVVTCGALSRSRRRPCARDLDGERSNVWRVRGSAFATSPFRGARRPRSTGSNVKIWPGQPYPLGANYDGSGTNFSVFSEHATKVELCFFDDDGK